jgi:pimeloyl-ACP methyl ester carboxylesterase
MLKGSYFILSDGRKLAYHDNKNTNGKPIILLHGAPGYMFYWHHLGGFPKDSKENRIITVDRCGFGESDYKKGNTFLRYSDDLVELLDHLKIKKTSILGLSGGGPFALAFAYRYPEKTDKTILLSSVGPITVSEIKRNISKTNRKAYKVASMFPWLMKLNMAGMALYFKKDAMKLFDKMSYKFCDADKAAIRLPIVRDAFFDNGKHAFVKTSKGYAGDVILQSKGWGFSFSSIKSEVIIFQCIDDTSAPIEMGRYFDSVIPNSTLHCIENAGHLWHMTNMDKVFDRI